MAIIKGVCSTIIFLFSLQAALAQPVDTLLPGKNLGNIIVYSQKFPEQKKFIAQYSQVVLQKSNLHAPLNTADALANSGFVFVQKSQQGGGSPVIRGFEASRVLLMIDGVRMNNAIYRAGHLQNVISVDNSALERIEILNGPASTLYGSDALGGAVNLYTISPGLSPAGKTFGGNAAIGYATATNSKKINMGMKAAGKKLATVTNISLSDFGDVVMGKRGNKNYPGYGWRNFYVDRWGEKDTVLSNPNPYKQRGSAYRQADFLQKILFAPKENMSHLLNMQLSTTGNVPRYDRLTDTAAGKPVYAEWYYGPQQRLLAAYQYHAQKRPGFFQQYKVLANYQLIKESRITRRFQNNNRDMRTEQVDIVGIAADAKHKGKKDELLAGIESYINFVDSKAQRLNIKTGTIGKIATRYADGPVSMAYHSLYAQHTRLLGKRFTLNDGLRFNYIKLDATFIDTAMQHFPFHKANQNNLAVTGNAGLIYNVDKTRAALVVSSGFRSPNVDDLSKVFESGNGIIIVPNAQIKPEYTYNMEINLSHRQGKILVEAATFYTLFKNALVLDNFSYNGSQTLTIDGNIQTVKAMQNKASAYLYGFTAGAIFVHKEWSMDGNVSYTYGKYSDAKNTTMPLDHIPPLFGRAGIKLTKPKWNAAAYSIFNGWKKLKNYNPNGEDNLQYATKDGTPSWFTINIKAAFAPSKKITATLLAENLLDRNYRTFASGITAPGRNIAIQVMTNF